MYHQDNIVTTQPPAVESSWSRCDNCLFLKALVTVPEGIAERWQMIAAGVPGKTAEEVRARYAALEQEVIEIESGRVPLPSYHDDKKVPTERKKGTPWTKEEHRRFLEGLIKYGKGDWKGISRNSVITRSATQVASHAQKYYIRQALAAQRKEKKRSSIHDITTTDTTVVVQQQPIPQPQPISFYSGEGGGRIEGTRLPQMGFEYQPNFGHPC